MVSQKKLTKHQQKYFDFFYIDFTPKMYYDCHKLFDSTSFAEKGAATTSIGMRPICMTDGLLHRQAPVDSRELRVLCAVRYDEVGPARSSLLLALSPVIHVRHYPRTSPRG